MENKRIKFTLRAKNQNASKLELVKAIKWSTSWGLKDSKDFVDNLVIGQPDYLILSIPNEYYKTLEEFKIALDKSGHDIYLEDKIRLRQLKLIELGLGDKSDVIEITSEYLASQLVLRVQRLNENKDRIYPEYVDFFQDFLADLEQEQLEKLIKKLST